MLSEKAWRAASKVFEAAKQHPFNQELMKGVLDHRKFEYYIEQDGLYLQDFARCHAMIASRAPTDYVRQFVKFAEETFIAEQEVVHEYFKKAFNGQAVGKITPTTLSYTSYLLRTCSIDPVEVAVAAVLPCFWVYYEVGCFVAAQSQSDNPYERWILTYSGEAFEQSVDQAIKIFNDLGNKASSEIQAHMIDAFYKSSVLEWHFWDDAYHTRVFDQLK